jgi:3-hydroxybutyrate dehydrogenase
MRLLGKVAVVTGAASGIGKVIARAFRREGAKIVVTDLNQADADETAWAGSEDAIGVVITQEVEVRPAWPGGPRFGRIDARSNAGIQIVAPLGD